MLKGKIITTGDEEFIVANNGRRVPLANASSGQQEVFPLLLMLLNLVPDEETDPALDGMKVLYIEEPEAHLFPESQRVIAQLMGSVYNKNYQSLQFFVTTHSPYLLSSFNNLIYAHQLAEQLKDQPDKLKELYSIVPKTQQLPLSDFKVYGLENGKAYDLIDAGSELLSADLLDSASDVTAQDFGALMALDPAIQA